jgi:hypothetical protein
MALGSEPCVIVEFSDWNLNSDITPETFSFKNRKVQSKSIFFTFQRRGKE